MTNTKAKPKPEADDPTPFKPIGSRSIYKGKKLVRGNTADCFELSAVRVLDGCRELLLAAPDGATMDAILADPDRCPAWWSSGLCRFSITPTNARRQSDAVVTERSVVLEMEAGAFKGFAEDWRKLYAKVERRTEGTT